MNGANIAAMNASLMAANSARHAEEARERRNRNKGNDEVYVEVDKHIDSIGKLIVGDNDEWYYEEEVVYERRSKIDVGALLLGGLIFGMGAVVIMFGILFFNDDMFDFLGSKLFWMITLAATAIGGIWWGIADGGDKPLSWITLTKNGNKTNVLITVYDEDGYRNIHEDEVHRLLKKLGVQNE